ncbi:amidohydrolase/deacetylase family metallohydrolase [Geminicoccus roseus]|uniref:amidohydrolase/deacetylase family metallohydrolase n=1 Tax=Geminicoccus roseus TaxID=404900 RepID=UPI0003FD6B9F|nr:amidohydrolase/deacetylase family metallohydrolase [Geminicoccus roseus]
MNYDLVLTGGQVVDPGQGIDRVTDVAFAGGKVAAVGDGLNGQAAQVRDVSGAIVMPGMIDFHTHVYWGGTSLGIRPDELARRAGTTTWLDVGSAGPGNFEGFREHVIGRTETKILAYLHISFAGIYGFSDKVSVGESCDMRLLEPNSCADVARANPDLVRGIKVRIGSHASGFNGITPLKFAIEAAEQANLPVMCHIDTPPPRYEDVLAVLRPGDTLTHCFRPRPNAPTYTDGRVREACFEARERGVFFDIGHGMGSFSFEVAEAMLAGGFPPDVISSDVHALCIDGPAYDNLETMSKFLHLGMSVNDIVRSVTKTPADILKRPDLADLSVGSTGDVTVLRVEQGDFTFVDVQGATRSGGRRFSLDSVVLDGRLWHDARAA